MLWFYNKCQAVPYDDENIWSGCNELDENTPEHEQCLERLQNYKSSLILKWWMPLVLAPFVFLFGAALFYLVEEPVRRKFKSKK